MATKLEKELKRELDLDGQAYILAISPAGLKLTVKGRRKGQELAWKDLVSGEAALAVALNASLGQARPPRSPDRVPPATPRSAPASRASRSRRSPRPRGSR